MASSRVVVCWPNRFILKAAAVLLGSVALGMILGAVWRREAKTSGGAAGDAQRPIKVRVYYTDRPEGVDRPAEVAVLGKAFAPGSGFRVPATNHFAAGSQLQFAVRLDGQGPWHRIPSLTWTDKTTGIPLVLSVYPGTPDPSHPPRQNGQGAQGTGLGWLSHRVAREAELPDDLDALQDMLNWLYARHNYKFTSGEKREYYRTAMPGYRPAVADEADLRFTPIELQNKSLLEKKRLKLRPRGA